MKLKELTENERIDRLKMQKREAQKRYYLKNKEYYKNYNKTHDSKAKKLQKRLDEIEKYVNECDYISQKVLIGLIKGDKNGE